MDISSSHEKKKISYKIFRVIGMDWYNSFLSDYIASRQLKYCEVLVIIKFLHLDNL